MAKTIPIQCSCGKLRGVATLPAPGRMRAVCYCDDCQTYAHFLGRAADLLDVHGGTEILSLRPAELEFTEGRDQLRCVRLAPTGMFRWYAGCCRTPVSNCLSPSLPFAGTLHPLMDGALTPTARDQLLGPVQVRMHGRYAIGTPPAGTHPKVPLRLLLGTVPFLLGGFARGAARPSPFFDDQGQPISTPEVLPPAERARLLTLCGPRPKLTESENLRP